MIEHRTPENYCLGCGKIIDALSHLDDDAVPEEGCATVCLYCGHVMALKSDLTVRELTGEEMRELAGNEELLAIQKIRGEIMKDEDDAAS